MCSPIHHTLMAATGEVASPCHKDNLNLASWYITVLSCCHTSVIGIAPTLPEGTVLKTVAILLCDTDKDHEAS